MYSFLKKRNSFICFLLAVCIIAVFILCSFSTNAETTKEYNKYFHSIEVQDGDTLWSIANTYMSEQYDSIEDYMDEICSLNHIEGTVIQKGWSLLIPYYATKPGNI